MAVHMCRTAFYDYRTVTRLPMLAHLVSLTLYMRRLVGNDHVLIAVSDDIRKTLFLNVATGIVAVGSLTTSMSPASTPA